VQAIGGVNEKIEGFYAVCKAKGLTGAQGVIIPRDNIRNLMLKPDVVKAIRDGEFNVWGISTIEEGIELLTDMPAGKLRRDGTYPEGTLFRRVTDALEAMTRRAIEVNRAAQQELMASTPAQPAAAAKRTRPGGNGARARRRRENP
jgi:predicted ATP-dependent protease